MSPRAVFIERQNRLLRLMPEVRWRLRHIPGIRSIGLGAKEVGGEPTGDWAFRVYVALKLARSEVRSDWRIPERIKGIPTDVLAVTRSELLVDRSKHRPLKGGGQVKNERVQMPDVAEVSDKPDPEDVSEHLAGTLGCLAELTDAGNAIVGLSCEHVLRAGKLPTDPDVPPLKIGQPKYVISCCCCTYNEIGTLLRVKNGGEVDCGLIALDEDIADEIRDRGTLNQVEGIPDLTGVAQAVAFERVRKRGRTTELTEGQVVDVLYEGTQILVHPTGAPKFADRGDSGSVLVNENHQVVGLLWATDAATRANGVANHIGPVMREMSIRIAGQDGAGLGIPGP